MNDQDEERELLDTEPDNSYYEGDEGDENYYEAAEILLERAKVYDLLVADCDNKIEAMKKDLADYRKDAQQGCSQSRSEIEVLMDELGAIEVEKAKAIKQKNSAYNEVADAYANKGAALSKIGAEDEANEVYLQAADALYNATDYHKSISVCDKVIELNSNRLTTEYPINDSACAYYYKCDAYFALGQPEKAMVSYFKAKGLNQDDSDCYHKKEISLYHKIKDIGLSENITHAIMKYHKIVEKVENFGSSEDSMDTVIGYRMSVAGEIRNHEELVPSHHDGDNTVQMHVLGEEVAQLD
jgi:tetratricopeptide (TPR) repeat protein